MCPPPLHISNTPGDVYNGSNTQSGEEVAVKLEPVRTKHPQLKYESRVYKELAGGTGIPSIRYFGTETSFNIMVMDLLGPSLQDLFLFCCGKLTLKTVLLLADQMVYVIGFLFLCFTRNPHCPSPHARFLASSTFTRETSSIAISSPTTL